jgi:ribosomal protein S18 acetylase RimI-like enzyme
MLRQATTNDAPKLDELNRKVLTENYPLEFWTEYIGASATAKYVIEEEQENDENNENNENDENNENNENDKNNEKDDKKKIVAYILAVLQHDKQKRVIGHVYSIGVLPECRKKGYGKRLLDASEKCLRRIRDIKCMTLHVRKTNTGGISFYQKLDYMRIKKVKEYYGKKQDGFLMRKDFY